MLPRAPAAGSQPASTATAAKVAAAGDAELPQGLTASFWFEPRPSLSLPVRVRFVGRRVDAVPPLTSMDRFVHEELIDDFLPGNGPVSISARLVGVSPGAWTVTASMAGPREHTGRPRSPRRPPPEVNLDGAQWSWRDWAVASAPARPRKTRLAQLNEFTRIPAVVPGSWAALVAIGIVIGFVFQSILLGRTGVDVDRVRAVSFLVVVAGIVGGKVWYLALHLRTWRQSIRVGWCIQGALAGATAVGIATLALMRIPVGIPMDMTAPGLFLGIAVGRLGCFFTGCCAGRPTASRWGVWCSDRRVGARRVPIQLWESLLALFIGVGCLLVVLRTNAAGSGALLIASFAAYTLGRQYLLRFRAEHRRTAIGSPVTAAIAGITLAGALAALVLQAR